MTYPDHVIWLSGALLASCLSAPSDNDMLFKKYSRVWFEMQPIYLLKTPEDVIILCGNCGRVLRGEWKTSCTSISFKDSSAVLTVGRETASLYHLNVLLSGPCAS